MHHLEVLLVAMFTTLAASFHIISSFHVQNLERHKVLNIISGCFWAVSGLILLLFVVD